MYASRMAGPVAFQFSPSVPGTDWPLRPCRSCYGIDKLLIAAFSRSTTARFPMRRFGTVRNRLNRAAVMARTEALPSRAPDARATSTVNALMTTLPKSGFDGIILREVFV